MTNHAVSYELAMAHGVTPSQYAEWNGRKLWALYGGWK